MVLTTEQKRVRDLLTETVTLLCKNGLYFDHELGIEALIGITLDKEDVFLVSIKETISSDRDRGILAHSFENSDDVIDTTDIFSSVCDDHLKGFSTFSSSSLSQQFSRQSVRKLRRNSGFEAQGKILPLASINTQGKDSLSSSIIKSEISIDADEGDISECRFDKLSKRHRGNVSPRVPSVIEVDLGLSSNILQDEEDMKFCLAAENNKTSNDVERESYRKNEGDVIEIKKETEDDDDLAESSYLAYANSFNEINCWNPSLEPKRLNTMSSDAVIMQNFTRPSTRTGHSHLHFQKSRSRMSSQQHHRHHHQKEATDTLAGDASARPDESDARRCPICGTVSPNWNVYLRHIRKHQPGMYRCPFCGKSFSGSTNLRGHLAIHTNVREFRCHLCEKAYAYKKDLSDHLIVKHGFDERTKMTLEWQMLNSDETVDQTFWNETQTL